MSEDLPQAPVRSHDREVWVGVFVLGGVAATLTALFTLTDASMFRGRYVITTVVQNAGGIRRGDPVQMRGVNIGRVQRFRIDQQGVAIRLEIEGEYRVPSDSRAAIKSGSLLGGMVAEIVAGSASQFLRNGDVIPGSTETGVFETANAMADQAQNVLGRMRTLLSDTTLQRVEGSSVELHKALADLAALAARERQEIGAINQSLRRSAEAVERTATRPELDRAVTRLDSLTERMDTVATNLDKSSQSMQSVLGRLDRGEGTLGKMAKDDALYANLDKAANSINQAAAEMRNLTQDIRRQPKKYLKLSVF